MDFRMLVAANKQQQVHCTNSLAAHYMFCSKLIALIKSVSFEM